MKPLLWLFTIAPIPGPLASMPLSREWRASPSLSLTLHPDGSVSATVADETVWIGRANLAAWKVAPAGKARAK